MSFLQKLLVLCLFVENICGRSGSARGSTIKHLCLHHCHENLKFCMAEISGDDSHVFNIMLIKQCNANKDNCLQMCKRRTFQECITSCATQIKNCFDKRYSFAQVSKCVREKRENCIKADECELKEQLLLKKNLTLKANVVSS